MKPKILIKKYTNRRLYLCGEKRYISLDELSARIREGCEVQVVDSKTGEDLTQPVLIQLILEIQKASGNYLFTTELLHSLIRYQERSLLEFFQNYLPNIFNAYLHWQEETQHQFLHWAKLGWSVNPFSNAVMPQFPLWGRGFGQGNTSSGQSSGDGQSSNPAHESIEQALEIQQLKQRIQELETYLKNTKRID